MDHQYNINTLVSKLLTGDINEQEGEALLQEVEKDPSLKDKIGHLMEDDDFLKRYHLYHSIDAEKAKENFFASVLKEEEPQPSATLVWLRRIAAAAVITLAIVGTWMYLGKQDPTKSAVITAELHQAMERIEQNGMNGATLIVGGKKMAVSNAQAVVAKAEQIEEEGGTLFGSEDIVEGSLVTMKDKEFWMVLDDGTYVHLNYNTTLVYPNHFVGSERKVKLKGEAYFVVGPDSKKRPFIVETANGDVHDYGTEFNVCTNREEGITSVVLVKGKVGVSSKHGKEYLLKPGEKAGVGCLTPTMRAGSTLELFTTKRSPGSRNSGRSRNTLCRMLSSFWLRTISRAASRGAAGSCAMSSLGKSYQKSFFNILCICLSDD